MSEADLEVLSNSVEDFNKAFEKTDVEDENIEERSEDDDPVEERNTPQPPQPITTASATTINEGTTQKDDLVFHENIFLQAGEGTYAPYTAHCVMLGNATVLIMLSQVCFLSDLGQVTLDVLRL